MTIQGSRRSAIQIRLGFAALELLLLSGLAAVTQVGFLLWLLRPSSLTFESADVVYRAGGRAKRAARSEIAGCAIAGQQWVWDGKSGSRSCRSPIDVMKSA